MQGGTEIAVKEYRVENRIFESKLPVRKASGEVRRSFFP